MFINPSPPLPFPNSCTTVLSRQRDQGLLKIFGQVHPNTASLPGLRPPSPSNFPNSAGGAGNLLSAHWHPLMNRLLAHFQDDGSTPSQSGRRQLSKGGTLRPTFAAGKGDLHPALGYKRQLFKGRLAIRLMPSHSWGGGGETAGLTCLSRLQNRTLVHKILPSPTPENPYYSSSRLQRIQEY